MASMDLITTELYQARVTQYGMAAGVTLVFYDIVLNIPKESILIWKSAPSLPKYVYFLSRYPVPLAYIAQIYIDGGFSTTPLSNQTCHAYWIWIVFFAFFEGFALGGCLIVLRVYVLYKAVRYSGILFTLLWIINWLPSTVAMAVAYGTWYTLDNENMIYLSIPGLCAPTDRPPWIWVLWICPIFFQSIVCGLLLYKFRENRHLQAGQYSGSLMSCLIRDGLLYNVTLLVCQTVNLIFYLALPDTLFLFAFIADWAISMSLIGRIYLNLRDVANHNEWTQATTPVDNTKSGRHVEPGSGRNTQEAQDVTIEMDSDWSEGH